MAYRKRTWKAGRVIEVLKSHDTKRPGNKKRQPRQKLTTEQQQKRNQKQRVKVLARQINANFGPGDYHLTATYSNECRPDDKKEAVKILKKFIRGLCKYYRQQGLAFKYIYVTEHRGRRIHHHLIIPAADIRGIQNLWTYGFVRFVPLDDSGQYKDLAAYLIKEAGKKEPGDNGKIWVPSQNLIRPEPEEEDIKAITWAQQPRVPEGYYIDELYNGVSEITGYSYQYYTLIKLPPKQRIATTAARAAG